MYVEHRIRSLLIPVAWLIFSVPALRQADSAEREEAGEPIIYERWEQFGTADGLPHDTILTIHVEDQSVWVGTAGGLALYQGGAWRSWTSHDGLPSAGITAIGVDDRTRDAWLGTWGGGLIRFSGGRFTQFDQLNSGLSGNLIFALRVIDDHVWVATNGGVSCYDTRSGDWDLYFERRSDQPEIVITDLRHDERYLYAAAWYGGVARFDLEDGQWSLPDRFAQNMTTVAGELIRCAATGSDDKVWQGTDHGLITLLDNTADDWVRYLRRVDIPQGIVAVYKKGRVVSELALKGGIPDNRVRCIAFQGDDIWVGTAAGLARGSGRVPFAAAGVDASPAEDREGGSATHPTSRGEPQAHSSGVNPENPTSVNVAVLRPGNRTIAVPGHASMKVRTLGELDRLAVQLAIEEANARGGYRGLAPFALTTGPEGTFRGWGWTTPEDDLPILSSRPDVWGVIGYLGPHSRITTAVALRAELPLVNFASTAATSDELINPWIFRCRSDSLRRLRLLLDFVFDDMGKSRVAVLRTPGRVAATRLDVLVGHARARGIPVVADLTCDPASDDLRLRLEAIEQSGADVLLTWCDLKPAAEILKALRREGMNQVFVGSDRLVGEEFADLVGAQPGAVIAPWPRKQGAAQFAKSYEERFRRPPAENAYLTYKAAEHLIQAVNSAGLDRVAIRRVLDEMSRGATGEEHCEHPRLGADEPLLALLQRGEWRPLTVADLKSYRP